MPVGSLAIALRAVDRRSQPLETRQKDGMLARLAADLLPCGSEPLPCNTDSPASSERVGGATARHTISITSIGLAAHRLKVILAPSARRVKVAGSRARRAGSTVELHTDLAALTADRTPSDIGCLGLACALLDVRSGRPVRRWSGACASVVVGRREQHQFVHLLGGRAGMAEQYWRGSEGSPCALRWRALSELSA